MNGMKNLLYFYFEVEKVKSQCIKKLYYLMSKVIIGGTNERHSRDRQL